MLIMKSQWIILWALLVWAVVVIGQRPDLEDADTSGWVDPGDMLNFSPGNAAKARARNIPGGQQERHKPPGEPKLPSISKALPSMLKSAGDMVGSVGLGKDGGMSTWDCEKELEEVQKRLAQLKTRYGECEEELGSSKTVSHMPFFKQYARTLLGHFQYEVDPGSTVTYSVEVELTSEDTTVLRRFVETDKGSVQDAHAVLSNMIKRVAVTRGLSQSSWNLEDTLGFGMGTVLQAMCILTLIPVAVKLYMSLNMSLLQVFLRVLLLLFLVSVPWNWWHMYKMAVAKRQAAALKAVPTECRTGLQGAAQSLFGYLRSTFTFQQDECTRYQEAMIVDPMWEVAPTQAIAVTITKFFVEPAEHIGTGLGKLIRGTLQDLPVQLWPIALGLLVMLSLVILIMSCGYRIRFFYLFGLEPSAERKVDNRLEGMASQMEKLMSSQMQMEKQLGGILPKVTELRPAIAEYGAYENKPPRHLEPSTLHHSMSYPTSRHQDVPDGLETKSIPEVHSAPVLTMSEHDLFPPKSSQGEANERVQEQVNQESLLNSETVSVGDDGSGVLESESVSLKSDVMENKAVKTLRTEEPTAETSCLRREEVEDISRSDT